MAIKMERRMLAVLLGLLLGSQYCVGQSGYTYGRPDVAIGGGGSVQGAGSTVGRPVVGGFPTAVTAAAAYPTAVTAYGGTGVGGAVNPAQTAFAGFPAQGLRPGSPTVAGIPSGNAGFVGATGGLPKRPVVQTQQQQRPTAGIYGVGQQQQFAGSGAARSGTGGGLDSDYDGDYSAIPGVPGVDYPLYAQVPPTNFDCAQQPLPGYYSDVEAQCQVFHICALNRTYSFLCPNGTIFSQETLVCVWWNQYDCAAAPSLYANNAFIYDYGDQGVPNNAGFQSSQVGFAGSNVNRSPATFQGSSAARNPGATVGSPGIFAGGVVRPTVASTAFGGVAQPAFPAASGNTAASRYTPNPTGQGAAVFPSGSPAAVTPTAFGSTVRANGYQPGGVQEPAFAAAQVAPKSSVREYLPPRRP